MHTRMIVAADLHVIKKMKNPKPSLSLNPSSQDHQPKSSTSNISMALRQRSHLSHTLRWCRHLSSTTTTPSRKTPLLYKPTDPTTTTTTTTVQLFSWGQGGSGQLGGGIEGTWKHPSPAASLLLPSGGDCGGVAVEVGISCGLFHSALLVDGELWVWGKGDGGRLGLGHEDTVFEPHLNTHVGGDVKSVALGGLHSLALNSLGEVFSWGYGGFGALGHSVFHRELLPRLVKGSWDGKICHIATSGTHTAAVTESGEVFAWGRDEGDGRLGLGPNRGPDQTGGLSIPSKVKALPVPVTSVFCGGFFTMALTKEGQLWNWGANSNYELGRGDKVGGWKPKPIPSLEDVRIIQIASGGYHSLALTDEGKVLSWGFGGHGQLGNSSTHNHKIPTPIEGLADEKVVYIACGGSTSAAVTDKGKLYMWGVAKDSQIGVPGLPDLQLSPVEVKFPMEEEEDDGLGSHHHVHSVAIGASHTLCLVSRLAGKGGL